MGCPLSRSTRAAASSALSFLSLAAVAGGAALDSPYALAPCLAGGRFFAAGVDAGVARFFLAVMKQLLGRRWDQAASRRSRRRLRAGGLPRPRRHLQAIPVKIHKFLTGATEHGRHPFTPWPWSLAGACASAGAVHPN